MKRNAVSLTMAAAMLTGMLGSAPAFAADLSNLPDRRHYHRNTRDVRRYRLKRFIYRKYVSDW